MLIVKSKSLCIGVSVFLIWGCASPMQPSQGRAPIPATLTVECPPLSPLVDGSAGSVLRKFVEVSEAYYDCAAKHRELVKAVR